MSDDTREHTQKLVSLVEILTAAVQVQATDVHLKAGIVPVIRRHGSLRPLSNSYAPLTAGDLDRMAMEMLDEDTLEHFKKYKEVDISWGVRCFIFWQTLTFIFGELWFLLWLRWPLGFVTSRSATPKNMTPVGS